MNPELREAVGKACYNALCSDDLPCWQDLTEGVREAYRKEGEAAVEAFLSPFLPGIIILGKELIKNNPSMRDTINQVFHQATGRDLE